MHICNSQKESRIIYLIASKTETSCIENFFYPSPQNLCNRPFRENLFFDNFLTMYALRAIEYISLKKKLEIRYLCIHINACMHNAYVIVNSGNPKSSFPGFVKPRGLSRAMCLQVERRKGDSQLCQRIIRQVFKLKSMPFTQKSRLNFTQIID